MTWTVFDAEQKARDVAKYLSTVSDDTVLERIIQDIAAAVERQPRSVRGTFWMELARSCDETMLRRFFRLTAAERDTEGDQR